MGLNKESRTINAGKNVYSAVVNKFVIFLLTFISRKIFIQYIGVEYLGINGLFTNVLTLLSMADLGLSTAMNVSLYKPIAEGDTRRLAALLNYFRKLYYFIAIAVMCIGTALLPFLKYIVNMDADIPHLYLYYMLFVAKNAVSYLYMYKSAIINADQKTYLINKIEVFVNIVKMIVQVAALVIFKSYFVYLLLDIAGVAAHNIVVSITADKNYPFIKADVELKPVEKKGIFGDVSSVALYKVAWSLLNGTDNILMSAMVGTIYVGYYSNYYTITNTLTSFIALLFNSLTAGVGNLVATSAPEKRYKTFKSMQMVSFWLCGIVTICLFFLTQDFIILWVGEGLLLDNLTLIAIVLNTFFSICMRPVWTFREGTGMYKQIRYIMLVTAILNIVLSVILGKWLGISGILFATSISKLSTYFWYEPNILFKNFFHQPVLNYYIDYIKNTVLLIICAALCAVPLHFIKEVSVINWLVKAIICFVVINIVYFVRYCKTEEFTNIKDKALKLLKRA